MTLRICHFGKYYPPARGGIETHVRALAQAQTALGACVHVVCVNHTNGAGRNVTWSPWASTPRIEEQDGKVRVTRLGRFGSFARWDYCPSLRRALADLLREPFDILHLHVPNPTMMLGLATLPWRPPLTIGYHSDIVRQKLLALAIQPFERLVFTKAARIFVASPTYSRGSPSLQCYGEKLDVLPYGLDLRPYLEPSPEARKYADYLREQFGSPLWLCVGRLVYYKGLHVALEALKQAEGRLLIIGTGPEESPLQQQAVRLGVSDRVVWLGPLDEPQLVGAYHAATALWFPSNTRSEAFGLVQVEAMASGCPVINTRIKHSGVSWVSPHQETGLTVAVNDPAALAKAAHRLHEEPGLRLSLKAAARQRAVQEFDDQKMAERSLDVYREVLSCRRRQAAA
jgi:rhamnosyl/mannosyltransferase